MSGDWRLEVGGWRLEVGGWRLEVGGWRLEVGGLSVKKLLFLTALFFLKYFQSTKVLIFKLFKIASILVAPLNFFKSSLFPS